MITAKPSYSKGKPPLDADVLWRCEARSYAYCVNPDYDKWAFTAPRIEIRWCTVSKRTPKGARLDDGRFVLLTARKKWACNTEAEAVASFIARRQRQIRILTKQLDRAKDELKLAEAIS